MKVTYGDNTITSNVESTINDLSKQYESDLRREEGNNQDISATEQGTETRDITDSRAGQTTPVSRQDIRNKQRTNILNESISELTTIVNGLETRTEAKDLFNVLIDLVNTNNPNLTIVNPEL